MFYKHLEFCLKLVYNSFMAKRPTGVGKRGRVHSPKTKKRRAAKAVMLEALSKKRGYKGRSRPKDQ